MPPRLLLSPEALGSEFLAEVARMLQRILKLRAPARHLFHVCRCAIATSRVR